MRTLQRCFYYLILSAVVGYVYEFLLLEIVYDGFTNRGPTRGPYLWVYGVGGLVIILLLGPLRKRKLHIGKVPVTGVVIGAAIYAITSVVEYFASWLMQQLTGVCTWNYTGKWLNLHGRICFEDTFRFTLLGLFGIYIIVPLLDRFLAKAGPRVSTIIFWVLFGLVAIDCVTAAIWPMEVEANPWTCPE
ncbi:MAG: putative ABC transporter permease [Propionibacteriaceae bacterium]|jgi:uncharacterized membrane protein|nr:putative ABC transporter permease [Propionibacteriaceae bacterium]